MKRLLILISLLSAGLFIAPEASLAYPEFQVFVQKNSGRPVNCAMCHVSSDGPEGTAAGQIGGLNSEEMNRLAMARLAFAPGQNVDSPILNAFGNSIIRTLGKTKFLELRSNPAGLADALGYKSDLDQDGIPDAREFLDGTHPLLSTHGDPLLLLWYNLQRFRFHVIMITIATLAGLYGLNHLVKGLAARAEVSSASVHTTHSLSSKETVE